MCKIIETALVRLVRQVVWGDSGQPASYPIRTIYKECPNPFRGAYLLPSSGFHIYLNLDIGICAVGIRCGEFVICYLGFGIYDM